jgi:hypothetical protein|tara:strand:- start:158 stop:385 length:228 start_codon:yes stop_codon:yes gene_type:complete
MPTKIKNEPNWENMFEVTKSIVNSSDLPIGQRQLVIQMLEYGKQLHITKDQYAKDIIKRFIKPKIPKKHQFPKFD